MSILNESQKERDIELSKLFNKTVQEIEKIVIASPDSIRVYDKEDTPKDLTKLYKEYKYLDLLAYLKTLMNRSAKSRHPELFRLLKETKNKVCLDFGSGVGTHSIALAENNNNITMLDVEGSELMHFAMHRLMARGYMGYNILYHNETIPYDEFDVVICSDVLEHVQSPLKELQKIHKSMKVGAVLHLLVSTMRKFSSGHFDISIDEWLKDGVPFMKKYFIKSGQTIYKKL